jgi:hypothetical protein
MTDTLSPPNPAELTISIGRGTLSFSATEPGDGAHAISHEPYVVKSGISMAANLREAFRTSTLLAANYRQARVEVDAPVLLVPAEIYDQATSPELFAYTFPRQAHHAVLSQPVEELGVVVVFGMNKDLKQVIEDHFQSVCFVNAITSVWQQLHRHSLAGVRSRLYAYFHAGWIDIFSFSKNRFKFANQFDAANADDALYYLLYVWKQLMLKPEHDELFLLGQQPRPTDDNAGEQWLTDELRRYVGRVDAISLDQL